jgi:hypothetical protein
MRGPASAPQATMLLPCRRAHGQRQVHRCRPRVRVGDVHRAGHERRELVWAAEFARSTDTTSCDNAPVVIQAIRMVVDAVRAGQISIKR